MPSLQGNEISAEIGLEPRLAVRIGMNRVIKCSSMSMYIMSYRERKYGDVVFISNFHVSLKISCVSMV